MAVYSPQDLINRIIDIIRINHAELITGETLMEILIDIVDSLKAYINDTSPAVDNYISAIEFDRENEVLRITRIGTDGTTYLSVSLRTLNYPREGTSVFAAAGTYHVDFIEAWPAGSDLQGEGTAIDTEGFDIGLEISNITLTGFDVTVNAACTVIWKIALKQ